MDKFRVGLCSAQRKAGKERVKSLGTGLCESCVLMSGCLTLRCSRGRWHRTGQDRTGRVGCVMIASCKDWVSLLGVLFGVGVAL